MEPQPALKAVSSHIERPDEQGTERLDSTISKTEADAVTLRDPMNRGLKVNVDISENLAAVVSH